MDFMKKLIIVGRGTVGCLAISHFLRYTNWQIEWIFDPTINPVSVGEGTNLIFPSSLYANIGFDGNDMEQIHATAKMGIWKRGWADGHDFKHTFPAGSVGMHFNAVEFQRFMFEKFRYNKRITINESNVSNYDTLDSDFVMVCAGSPVNINENYNIRNSIPVNSCLVFQCPWEFPKFNFSLTFARKYGWVFGIPLKNRCSIGYMYNSNFCSIEDVKLDVLDVFEEFDLEYNDGKELHFNNYSKIDNFDGRICYNGNASFFLEPLEATSTGFSESIMRIAFDVWNGKLSNQKANYIYDRDISEIESMICLHYLAGSHHNSKFWENATELGKLKIEEDFKSNNRVSKILKNSILSELDHNDDKHIGTWPLKSYGMHIKEFNLTSYISKF